MCTQVNCSLNGMEDREVHLCCLFFQVPNRDGRFVLILFEIGSKGAHLGLIVLRFLKLSFDRTSNTSKIRMDIANNNSPRSTAFRMGTSVRDFGSKLRPGNASFVVFWCVLIFPNSPYLRCTARYHTIPFHGTVPLRAVRSATKI